jgi:hypothetical protein
VPESFVYRDIKLPISVVSVKRCAIADKLEIIKKYPIGKGFDAFREAFNSICKNLGYHEASDVIEYFDNESKIPK